LRHRGCATPDRWGAGHGRRWLLYAGDAGIHQPEFVDERSARIVDAGLLDAMFASWRVCGLPPQAKPALAASASRVWPNAAM